MIRKNVKTGKEILIDDNTGLAYVWVDAWTNPKWDLLEDFCITNDWKKKI